MEKKPPTFEETAARVMQRHAASFAKLAEAEKAEPRCNQRGGRRCLIGPSARPASCVWP